MGNKFIEKMEALLRNSPKKFVAVLSFLTVLAFAIYGSISLYFRWNLDAKYYELLNRYMSCATCIFVVAGILWIIYLGNERQKKEWDKLDKFLEERWNEEFTRADLVKQVYGQDYASSTSQYKALGNVLRNAVEDGRIRELNEWNPRKYQRVN